MNEYILLLIFFGIALFYSSIGFGGGSSYLALLSLVLVNFYEKVQGEKANGKLIQTLRKEITALRHQLERKGVEKQKIKWVAKMISR